jgi:hypothetical protein
MVIAAQEWEATRLDEERREEEDPGFFWTMRWLEEELHVTPTLGLPREIDYATESKEGLILAAMGYRCKPCTEAEKVVGPEAAIRRALFDGLEMSHRYGEGRSLGYVELTLEEEEPEPDLPDLLERLSLLENMQTCLGYHDGFLHNHYLSLWDWMFDHASKILAQLERRIATPVKMRLAELSSLNPQLDPLTA